MLELCDSIGEGRLVNGGESDLTGVHVYVWLAGAPLSSPSQIVTSDLAVILSNLHENGAAQPRYFIPDGSVGCVYEST